MTKIRRGRSGDKDLSKFTTLSRTRSTLTNNILETLHNKKWLQ